MIVFFSASALAAALGAWAARSERHADERHADEMVRRVAQHPARGLESGGGKVVVGELLSGIDPTPASKSVPEVPTPAPTPRPAPARVDRRPACPGHLRMHRDGTTSCHGGYDDCWGDDGPYSHIRRHPCSQESHGCGVCDVINTNNEPRRWA